MKGLPNSIVSRAFRCGNSVRNLPDGAHNNRFPSATIRLMQPPSLNRRAAIFSILVACGSSALAWAFNPAWFLTFPGALLTMVIFGRIASMTNRPLRLTLNVIATSIVLYLGAALWARASNIQKQPALPATRELFIVWLILLVPWMLFGPLSAMAFDGGDTAEAYVFFWSSITYPVSVVLAALFRRWSPHSIFLPVLNFTACFASPLLHK